MKNIIKNDIHLLSSFNYILEIYSKRRLLRGIVYNRNGGNINSREHVIKINIYQQLIFFA